MRKVVIVSTVSIRRPRPTPAQAALDKDTQAKVQAIIDDDMRDRAKKLEALLNQEGSTL